MPRKCIQGPALPKSSAVYSMIHRAYVPLIRTSVLSPLLQRQKALPAKRASRTEASPTKYEARSFSGSAVRFLFSLFSSSFRKISLCDMLNFFRKYFFPFSSFVMTLQKLETRTSTQTSLFCERSVWLNNVCILSQKFGFINRFFEIYCHLAKIFLSGNPNHQQSRPLYQKKVTIPFVTFFHIFIKCGSS